MITMSKTDELAKIIGISSNIVFFGGAGMSTESGIPDFRSADGIYNQKLNKRFSPEEMVSHTFLTVSLDREDAEMLFAAGKPSPEKLAELVPDSFKRAQKYDYLISGPLLDMEYAAANLDIDGAWEVLERLISME